MLPTPLQEKGYSCDQVFNTDETGLWKQLPSKSLCHAREIKPKNNKKAKDRITLMACANMSGTFCLPLMFVNKSMKPRCFKHMDMSSLPVDYFSQNKSWVDRRVFRDWFQNKFMPLVKRFCSGKGIPFKILLLLDNAPGHPDAIEMSNENVNIVFLPPNTTSIIQPMDQGCLDPLKQRYKKQLLHYIIIERDNAHLSIPDVLKKVTLKEAVYWAAIAGKKHHVNNSECDNPDDLDHGSTSVDNDEELQEMFVELGYQEDNNEWQSPAE